MTQAHDYETRTLDALKRAVAEALERKRRLGQYAVFWCDGKPVCIGPDAPLQYAPGAESAPAATRVAEPGKD